MSPRAMREAIVGDCSEKFEEDVAKCDLQYARQSYFVQALRMTGPWLMKLARWLLSVIIEAYIRSRF